jgi:imidazolonepropionase-like amidohydrolase
MRRYSALLLVPLLLASSARPNAAKAQKHLVLTHVTVIDVAGGPARPDYTVVITGDRITEMGDSANVPVPEGSDVVDATGKFLIPGLWDMHVHPTEKEYLPLFIANGVTGVRVMWGFPAHHEWRRAVEAGQLLGPHTVIASPLVDGPKPYWDGSTSVANEAQARQAVIKAKQDGADFVKVYQFLPRDLYFAIADEAKKQGIPFAGHVPLTVSAGEASRADQRSFEHLIGILPACSTRNEELTKAAQADFAEDLLAKRPKFWGPHMAQLRQAMLDSCSADGAAVLSTLLKANGTWQCPTLTLLRMFGYGDDLAFLNDPRLKYLPRQVKEFWDPAAIDKEVFWDPAAIDGKRTPEDFAYMKKEFQKDLEIVGTMQKSGVGILAGTDTPNPFCFPGFSLHDELGLLVRAGLSPMEALRAATLNPARYLGREKDFGTVENGKIADLVLLDANPLDDIANTKKISAVIYGGKFFARASLDEMLANVEAHASKTPLYMSILIWLVKNVSDDSLYHIYLPIGIALLLATYVYMALALVAIAKKTDTAHAVWGWIPIMNVVLMLKIARKPVWWIILLLIPLVNIVFAAVVWMRIAETRQKPKWWGVLAIVPVVNLIVPGYLAWSV